MAKITPIYVPATYDPTSEEFPLRGPTCRTRLITWGLYGSVVIVVLVIFLVIRSANANPARPTLITTSTVTPTGTLQPSQTPSVTSTVQSSPDATYPGIITATTGPRLPTYTKIPPTPTRRPKATKRPVVRHYSSGSGQPALQGGIAPPPNNLPFSVSKSVVIPNPTGILILIQPSSTPDATPTQLASKTTEVSDTPTPIVSPMPSSLPTLTQDAILSATPTTTPVNTLTSTSAPTVTATDTQTSTSTPTRTPTDTQTSTPTLTETSTPTLTLTATQTPSSTLTDTPTATQTLVKMATHTATP